MGATCAHGAALEPLAKNGTAHGRFRLVLRPRASGLAAAARARAPHARFERLQLAQPTTDLHMGQGSSPETRLHRSAIRKARVTNTPSARAFASAGQRDV